MKSRQCCTSCSSVEHLCAFHENFISGVLIFSSTDTLPTQTLTLNLILCSSCGSRFSGGIPSTLGNIGPQLQYLFLGYNKLSGAIPTSLYNLKGLQNFYLTGNQLTGAISPLVGQLTALTNLDFSNNKLTGTLPTAIGSLTQLGFFDMSGNKLTGTIPTSFGNLKNIYHFTINNNKISGQIPAVLAQNWKDLLFIDFSNNQLTGPIPQGAPFSTFPASSFAGNPGLCGNPLPACS